MPTHAPSNLGLAQMEFLASITKHGDERIGVIGLLDLQVSGRPVRYLVTKVQDVVAAHGMKITP